MNCIFWLLSQFGISFFMCENPYIFSAENVFRVQICLIYYYICRLGYQGLEWVWTRRILKTNTCIKLLINKLVIILSCCTYIIIIQARHIMRMELMSSHMWCIHGLDRLLFELLYKTITQQRMTLVLMEQVRHQLYNCIMTRATIINYL